MYPVGDPQWLMYPVGDGRAEEDLCHVRSGGHSVADEPSGGWERRGGHVPVGDTQWLMYPVGDRGGQEDLCHVRSGGHSVADVPSGVWERKGGSLPCTQWGLLSDTCTQWGMGEERRISAMYAVGDAH